MPSRHPRGFIEPSLLASELFGPAGSVNLSRLARSVSSKIAARPRRIKQIVDDPLKTGQDCPCLVQKNLDLYWQQHQDELKPIWDAAVKRQFTSGYEVFMKEAMTLAFRSGLLPLCPSPSGGYSCGYLIPSEVETPPAGEWIGKYVPPPAPVARFEEDVHTGDAPLTVTFTDRSEGFVTSWHWTFGDGGESEEQNPVHVYADPGTYAVNLEVRGPTGTDHAGDSKTVTSPLPPAWPCENCWDEQPRILTLTFAGFTGAAAAFNGPRPIQQYIEIYPCEYIWPFADQTAPQRLYFTWHPSGLEVTLYDDTTGSWCRFYEWIPELYCAQPQTAPYTNGIGIFAGQDAATLLVEPP